MFIGGGRIKNIDPRWNVNITWGPYRPARDCFVIHWTGPRKPWREPLAPHVQLYLEYAKMTQFYDQIRLDLLKTVNERIEYLNEKLWYKKYKLKRSIFDFRVFGRPIFPGKVAHYQRKIDKFLKQKKDKKLFYKKLQNLKTYLSD